MTKQPQPLYGKDQAECLRRREAMRQSDRIKHDLLLKHIGRGKRLVDIGCGWGKLLGLLQDQVEELWAVDESPDRIVDVRQACPKAKMVISRADRLALPNDYFDIVVTSQMLHEVKLFGRPGELQQTLSEIRRVLARGGRYLLLDHQDARDGEAVVLLPPGQLARLAEFERKYKCYKASHAPAGGGSIRISRRCLQDFLTKDWSLGSAMEAIEMDETHNVFQQQPTFELVRSAALRVREWIDFTDIRADLDAHGGKLIEGKPWCRKFLLIAEK